jgi:hypothetical protein
LIDARRETSTPIADCADLGIVPTLLRHPLRSRSFVPATSAQSCASGATQLCG